MLEKECLVCVVPVVGVLCVWGAWGMQMGEREITGAVFPVSNEQKGLHLHRRRRHR